MLGIAYAASIGGVATLIGTPPNAILAGVVEKQYGYSIGFAASGLTEWLGQQLTLLQGANMVILVGAVVLLVIFMTEVTSNTATASLLLPVMSGFALAAEIAPLALMASAALAASFAFMLPVATPPNAIVFASRQVTIPQMARVGILLNLIGAVLITGFISLVLPWLLELNVN